MVDSGKLNELRSRNLLRHEIRFAGWSDHVGAGFSPRGGTVTKAGVTAVEHQRRDADGGQHVADVNLTIHAKRRNRCSRAGGVSHESAPGFTVARVGREARRRKARIHGVGPRGLDSLQPRLQLRLGHEVRTGPGERTVQDECRTLFRVGGREERAHRATLRDAEQGCAPGARRLHHRPNVVHPLFENRQSIRGNPVGKAHTALVKQDQARERGEATEEAALIRVLPGQLNVSDPARDEDQIDRPLTEHLVGDMNVAAFGVLRLGGHGIILTDPRAVRRRHTADIRRGSIGCFPTSRALPGRGRARSRRSMTTRRTR